MSIYAVVVGIETYGEPGWNVESPARNALAVMDWLKDKTAANNIHLFLSAPKAPAADAWRLKGVHVWPATFDAIDTVLQGDLKNAPMGSQLLFYWCGHAVTDGHARRILFCGDYSQRLAKKVFNADLFFRELRTDQFVSFDESIALLDVCGVKQDVKSQPVDGETDHQPNRGQLICYATPEGQYALADSGTGAFTHTALEALNDFDDWPDRNLFRQALQRRLAAVNLPEFMVSLGDETGSRQILAGPGRRGQQEPWVALVQAIGDAPVGLPQIRRHYDATARQLSVNLLDAQGLTDMVRGLSGLASEAPGRAPRGLIQFLLRLREEELLTAVIDGWLEANARAMDVETEQQRLSREHGQLRLVMTVLSDEAGQLSSVGLVLRGRGGLVQDCVYGPYPITRLNELRDHLLETLRDLKSRGLDQNLEIHILAEPPAFGFAYHDLPSLNPYVVLGKAYVVVLHHLARTGDANSPIHDALRRQSDSLRRRPLDQLAWQPLPMSGQLPIEATLWFLDTPLKPGRVKRQTMVRLWDLLLHGAPVIYWPHDACDPGLHEALGEVLDLGEALHGLPESFRRARVDGRDVAQRGSLLWDEPNADLSTTTRGLIRR